VEFTAPGVTPVTIGYARLVLSTAALKQAIRGVVLLNLLASLALTLVAIVAVNLLVGRLILRPLEHLQASVARFKNGHLSDAFEAPAIDEVAGISRDFRRMSELVADREARLKVSETRLRELFERIEHAVFRLDASGAIIEANQKFRALCGPVGSFGALAPGGAAGAGGDRYLESARGGGIVHLEETITGAGGACLVILLSLFPVHDGAGAFAGFDGYFIDVTERAEMEDALREAYRELERKNLELQKLDGMKDALIRDVTHEFKTPVAKHAMQLELLRARLGEHCLGNVEEIVQVMERSVMRQQQVVRNLLDLSRLEAGWSRHELGPIRLDAALLALAKEEAPLLERAGAELRVSAPAMTVRGHEELLWHVFSNLLANALKYRGNGRTCEIRIEVAREDGCAVVRVRDNGIGLSPAQLARAFERFYQASASSEGAGVGLSICVKALEAMGGSIVLESGGLGAGVTAVVRLPLAESPEAAASARS
jgi:signal transduction histidine kinase